MIPVQPGRINMRCGEAELGYKIHSRIEDLQQLSSLRDMNSKCIRAKTDAENVKLMDLRLRHKKIVDLEEATFEEIRRYRMEDAHTATAAERQKRQQDNKFLRSEGFLNRDTRKEVVYNQMVDKMKKQSTAVTEEPNYLSDVTKWETEGPAPKKEKEEPTVWVPDGIKVKDREQSTRIRDFNLSVAAAKRALQQQQRQEELLAAERRNAEEAATMERAQVQIQREIHEVCQNSNCSEIAEKQFGYENLRRRHPYHIYRHDPSLKQDALRGGFDCCFSYDETNYRSVPSGHKLFHIDRHYTIARPSFVIR